MPVLRIVRIVLTVLCAVAAGVLVPVYAQYGPVGQPGYGIGPLFYLPDYEGDARGGDLYKYIHPMPWPYWYNYRMLVQQIAAQDGMNIYAHPIPYNFPGYGGAMAGGGVYTNVSGTVLPPGYASAPGLVGSP